MKEYLIAGAICIQLVTVWLTALIPYPMYIKNPVLACVMLKHLHPDTRTSALTSGTIIKLFHQCSKN